MITIHAKATKDQVQSLRYLHPSIGVDERFAKDSVNLNVPEELVDDVFQWCDDHLIKAELV